MSLDLLLTGQLCYMQNNDFDVLAVSSSGDEWRRILKREKCNYCIIEMTRRISPFKDLISLCRLITLFIRTKPDIVHTHTPKAGLLGMLAAKITRVPVRIHTIAGLPMQTMSGLKKVILINTEKLTYRASNYVLANSMSIKQIVQRENYVNHKKLGMIGYGSTNGINLEQFSKENLNSEILNLVKKKIDYQSQFTYLLSVGRIVRDKGIVELIDAFVIISKEISSLKLVLVGDLENFRSSDLLPNKTLEAIESNSNIIFVGWSEYVQYYMHVCDIFIHASHREGFPNVVLQAGAMKCPIICSDIPGNIDIIEHRTTGLLFQCKNTLDLIDKVKFAYHNPSIISRYSAKLHMQIKKFYSREFVHKSLLEFYISKLEKSNCCPKS